MTSQEIADSLVEVEPILHTTDYLIRVGERDSTRASIHMRDQLAAVYIAAAIKAAIVCGIEKAHDEKRRGPEFL